MTLANPVQAVDKSMGKYVIHSDYTTSQELNAFQATEADLFYVQVGEEIYEMRIDGAP